MKRTLRVLLETDLVKDRWFKEKMNAVNKRLSKKYFYAFLSAGLLAASVLYAMDETTGASLPRKSTNVTVASSDLDPFSLNEKTDPKEKRPVFYSDDKASVDINENGEPNMNMRF